MIEKWAALNIVLDVQIVLLMLEGIGIGRKMTQSPRGTGGQMMENDKLVRMEDVKTAIGLLALKYNDIICGDVRQCVESIPAVGVETCDTCVHHIDDGCLYCTRLGMLCPDAKFYCKYGKRPNYGAKMDGRREEEHNAAD